LATLQLCFVTVPYLHIFCQHSGDEQAKDYVCTSLLFHALRITSNSHLICLLGWHISSLDSTRGQTIWRILLQTAS